MAYGALYRGLISLVNIAANWTYILHNNSLLNKNIDQRLTLRFQTTL
jgi:hypothetical protein